MERRVGVIEVLGQLVNTARSSDMQRSYREVGQHLYGVSRWVLASVLHPVATFQAVMLIGDQERINRNVERALSLPKLPIGRQRLHR